MHDTDLTKSSHSEKKTMASKVFLKGTRLGLLLLFLQCLSPSYFVSGQVTLSALTSVSSLTTSNALTTAASISATSIAASSSSANSSTTAATTTSPSSSSSSSLSATTSGPVSSTTIITSSMASSATTSSSSSSLSTPAIANTTGVSSVTTVLATSIPSSTSSQPSGNSSTTATGSAPSGNTTWSMTKLSCPSFICNYSDCYTMYNNNNASACPTDKNFCQLMACGGIKYMASCTTLCAAPCDNTTTVNCSKGCCNTTNCLSPTFLSMMSTNITEVTPTITASTKAPISTTLAPAPSTTASTGKYCHKGTCSNKVDCYKDFTISSMCLSTLMHCELKKETSGTTVTWTAGCIKDCSTATWCTATSSTCNQECCNATTTSCLKLTGNLNVPSSATGGQSLPLALLFTVLLACLLSMNWLV